MSTKEQDFNYSTWHNDMQQKWNQEHVRLEIDSIDGADTTVLKPIVELSQAVQSEIKQLGHMTVDDVMRDIDRAPDA